MWICSSRNRSLGMMLFTVSFVLGGAAKAEFAKPHLDNSHQLNLKPIFEHPAAVFHGTIIFTSKDTVFLNGYIPGPNDNEGVNTLIFELNKDGKKLGIWNIGDVMQTAAVEQDNSLSIFTNNGEVYTIDLADKKSKLVKTNISELNIGGAGVAADAQTIAATSADHHLYFIYAKSGVVRKKFDFGTEIIGVPAIIGDYTSGHYRFYVRTEHGQILVLTESFGPKEVAKTTASGLFTNFALNEQYLFAGDNSGVLWRVSIKDNSVAKVQVAEEPGVGLHAYGKTINVVVTADNGKLVLAGDSQGYLHFLSPDLDRLATPLQLRQGAIVGITVFDKRQRALIVNQFGYCYLYDLRSGKIFPYHKAKLTLSSASVNLAETSAFLGTEAGSIYKLDLPPPPN